MIKNVIDYLKISVHKYPDRIALVDENRKITFSELDKEAQKVAKAIVGECGNVKRQPIATYMSKSVDCIIAFLGIAYSGNFYSPLDYRMPHDRIQKILNVLRPVAIICHKKILKDIQINSKLISLPDIMKRNVECNIDINIKNILDSDPLYVLFTSGSTGQPKGVVICHKSVIDYIEWVSDIFHFDEKIIFGNQAPFYFDNSILDIYSMLKNGSTMNIIPERLFAFPVELLKYINDNQINTLFWVPSVLIDVANSGAIFNFHIKSIKTIMFCGEVMPNRQLNMWRKEYPEVLFANLYGPTEITDVCTYYIVDREFADEETLPIGKACENTEILVLNDKDMLVNTNEIGELCVRGTCLSLGYYDDFEKTNQTFVQNPLNNKYRDLIYRTGDLVKYNEYGEIIYICRKDNQIKHLGYRIELGEIETIGSSIEGIERVCALYDDLNKKIIMFCALDSDNSELTEKKVYAWLKQRLPTYMLPAKIFLCEHLPVNANGKIDRMEIKRQYKEKNFEIK